MFSFYKATPMRLRYTPVNACALVERTCSKRNALMRSNIVLSLKTPNTKPYLTVCGVSLVKETPAKQLLDDYTFLNELNIS